MASEFPTILSSPFQNYPGFPLELIRHCLHYLPPETIACAAKVCKVFYHLIHNEEFIAVIKTDFQAKYPSAALKLRTFMNRQSEIASKDEFHLILQLYARNLQFEENMATNRYVASIQGPFEGFFPRFVNQRFLFSSTSNRYALKFFDLEENTSIFASSSNISFHGCPLYKDYYHKEVGIISGYNPLIREFIISPIFDVKTAENLCILQASKKFILTADIFSSLKIWDATKKNTCLLELKNAVSCRYEMSDYVGSDDEPLSEIVCNEDVLLGPNVVAVLKDSAQVDVWDREQGTLLHSLTPEQTREFQLIYHRYDDDRLAFINCEFYEDYLIIDRLENDERVLFTLNIKTLETQKFPLRKSEIFLGIFQSRALTLFNHALYLKDISDEGEEILYWNLKMPIKSSHLLGDKMLILTKDNEFYLLDLFLKKSNLLIFPDNNLNYDRLENPRFIGSCLFLEFNCIIPNSNVRGFKLVVVDFLPGKNPDNLLNLPSTQESPSQDVDDQLVADIRDYDFSDDFENWDDDRDVLS